MRADPHRRGSCEQIRIAAGISGLLRGWRRMASSAHASTCLKCGSSTCGCRSTPTTGHRSLDAWKNEVAFLGISGLATRTQLGELFMGGACGPALYIIRAVALASNISVASHVIALFQRGGVKCCFLLSLAGLASSELVPFSPPLLFPPSPPPFSCFW